MRRRRTVRTPHSSGTVLAAGVAGAVAGLALGMLAAQKLGGLDGIRQRLRRRPTDEYAEEEASFDLESMRESAGEAFPDDDDDPDADSPISHDPAEAEAEAETEQLESRVLESFLSDASLRGRSIDISGFEEGVIQLSGWVNSNAERRHATALARGVPGVITVVNDLFVAEPEELDAEDLAPRT